MTDEQPVTSDEAKVALRPVRNVVERLPKNGHTERAEKSLDTLRDEIMHSLEASPPTIYTGE